MEFDSFNEFMQAIDWRIRLGKYEKVFTRTRLSLLLNVKDLDHSDLFEKFCNDEILTAERKSKNVVYSYYPSKFKEEIRNSIHYKILFEKFARIGIKIGEIII